MGIKGAVVNVHMKTSFSELVYSEIIGQNIILKTFYVHEVHTIESIFP